MTTVWGKRLYNESVACVCFIFGTIFLNFAFFYGNWVLNGCDDYFICTNNWYNQISLEFRKRLANKGFIWKVTSKIAMTIWK